MPTTLGSLRSLVMTPSLADVSFAKRGFPVTETDATRRLEAIPQSVVCGFEWGIDARDLWELERRLGLVEPEMRGFAYEGATMALTIRDAMPGRGGRTKHLLQGPGKPHIFLTYIGIGFAMARLPRPLWRKVLPDLEGVPYHPTMSWLAVDGLGFDRAYFDTERWVGAQKVPAPYAWEQGHAGYFTRAFDQGIGRALWFIHGGQVPEVIAGVQRFASGRQADLWSGVGLAATFAGGCAASDLSALRGAAGEHSADLVQGAIFAAKARHFAGFEPPHTEAAIQALADMSLEKAALLADDVAADGLDSSTMPRYEVWRAKVRETVGERS
jgi:hypothetical protein